MPDFLAGWKTVIASGLALFVAINAQLHFVSSDVQATILAFATALGLYGLKCAIERCK